MLRVILVAAMLIPNPAAASAVRAPQHASPESAQNKKAQLKQLVDLLKSFSDEDYKTALKQAGPDAAGHPELSSRAEAIKTGYTTLAALEYHAAAAQSSAGEKSKYDKAYRRVLAEDAAAVAIDPETLQETGRGWDILKMAAKVALKVGMTAAILAVGREIKSPEETKREEAMSRYEGELAGAAIAPDKKAEIHYQLGSAYLQAAAAVSVEEKPLLSEDKRARLGQLANFLQAISDADYQSALGQVIVRVAPAKGRRPGLLDTRSGALQATYTSMAALEYERASRSAPDGEQERFAAAYQRAAKNDADAFASDPQNIQETGWAVDLLKFLGNAAINYQLGGGQVFVGRQMRSPQAHNADRQIARAQKDLARKDLSPEQEAEARFQLAAAYEARAAAAASPESLDESGPTEAPAPKIKKEESVAEKAEPIPANETKKQRMAREQRERERQVEDSAGESHKSLEREAGTE